VESTTMYKCGQVQSAEEYICRWILLIEDVPLEELVFVWCII